MLKHLRRHGPKVAGHSARVLHRIAELVLGLIVVVVVALSALAWRLSQGPLDLPWLTHRLEAAANDGGQTHLEIGRTALAWEGFSKGVDQPLDIRLTDVRVSGASGASVATIPAAKVALSPGWLLLGRIVPRAIEIDHPRLTVERRSDGAITLNLGAPAGAGTPPQQQQAASPLPTLLAELAAPPQGDRGASRDTSAGTSRFSQLRRVLISNAQMTVVDHRLGATWRAPDAEIDLRRHASGGVTGHADITLALGNTSAKLTADADLAPGAGGTVVRAHLTPVTPADLAYDAPKLAPLAAVDAPAEFWCSLDLGPSLDLRHFDLRAALGAGRATIGQGEVPLRMATLDLSGNRDAIALRDLRVTLPGTGADTVLRAEGRASRANGRIDATIGLDLDHVAFADLPTLWPPAMAHDARAWITENITDGIARDGHVQLRLQAPGDDPTNVSLLGVSGQLTGEDLTVHWLRPVPPIQQGHALLTFEGPDSVMITVQSGHQNGLSVHGGSVHITGLSAPHQVAAIAAEITGSLPDALSFLAQKRLHVLDRFPLPIKAPAGAVDVQLSVKVPLENKASMDDIAVSAQAKLADVHLGGVIAGHDLDNGQLDLDVNTDRLKLSGNAALAGIPARLNAQMDFRAGPASQVIERATIIGQADAAQLASLGVDARGWVAGPMGLQADYAARRDKQAQLSVQADLTRASVAVDALGWGKPAGQQAHAQAKLLLDHDRIAGIDGLKADGQNLSVLGQASFANGKPSLLRLTRAEIGRTSVAGQIAFARQPGDAMTIRLQGERLDLAPRLSRKAKPKAKAEPESTGPPWVLDARIGQTWLADGPPINSLTVHAESDGRVIRRARLESGAPEHAEIVVAPDRQGRSLTARAQDAGALLRALDIIKTMQGGRLAVNARFDDAAPGHPLAGTATIDDFRIRNAPALGKLLQAMTLYGLVQAVQGPGLGFSQLIAPFRLSDDALDLNDARAFSASLGLTAKGRIDLARNAADLQGTIVPAYFFNSLLGHVPLIGRLFSPEKGGGVFAATYAVRGNLDNPSVSVNPLAAVTPGFLRGVFGIFDQKRGK